MIRRNKKDLFLKIAGRRYTPRLCRVFRRQLILVPYAATRAPAHSPPAKQASSDSISKVRSHFQPRNTSECCLSRQRCLDPTSVQRLIVDRERRTRRDI